MCIDVFCLVSKNYLSPHLAAFSTAWPTHSSEESEENEPVSTDIGGLKWEFYIRNNLRNDRKTHLSIQEWQWEGSYFLN